MSLAEAVRAPRSVYPSARFLRSELGMVFRRRRNQALLVVLGCVPLLIAIAIKVSGGGNGDNGNGPGGTLFGSITENGVFVAFSALFVVIPLFLPMAVAVVAGDAVSGEANLGTLRYLLAVPVGRTRLLAVKFAGVLVWCLTCAVVVATVGVLIGLVLFGGGDVTLLSGTSVSFGAGLWRLAFVVGYVAVNIAAIGAIGLFVSRHPARPDGPGPGRPRAAGVGYLRRAVPDARLGPIQQQGRLELGQPSRPARAHRALTALSQPMITTRLTARDASEEWSSAT